MNAMQKLYSRSQPLLTDLYQLTMAMGYWKLARMDKEAVFNLFYRRNPFGGGYALACGLANVVAFVGGLGFDESDLAYLRSQKGSDGSPLFDEGFLEYLGGLRFTCDVDAVPEGTVVFPQEPLVRVRGPLLQCQLLETPLLNLVNFPTLIATKASRVCRAAGGDPVLEFGLRRAQGIDGGVTASRAAYIGGCTGTSNVLAGKLYGIPVKGTHAHSWVMSFDGERESFEAYAEAMPNNCVFLVDTYDTLEGVRNAVAVGRRLRRDGYKMVGVRLDSGDLAYLSKEARKILDEAGFEDTAIVASNDLDERLIQSLKDQGAAIGVWGVGTRLATAHDDPALGGVYKLTAIRDGGGEWQYRLKVSEQQVKNTTPGVLQVRRFREGGQYAADMIYDEGSDVSGEVTIVDPLDMTRRRRIAAGTEHEDLLVPVFRQGRAAYECPPLGETRRRAQAQLAGFHEGIRRFDHPHAYPVGLEEGLHELKTRLILEAREGGG